MFSHEPRTLTGYVREPRGEISPSGCLDTRGIQKNLLSVFFLQHRDTASAVAGVDGEHLHTLTISFSVRNNLLDVIVRIYLFEYLHEFRLVGLGERDGRLRDIPVARFLERP